MRKKNEQPFIADCQKMPGTTSGRTVHGADNFTTEPGVDILPEAPPEALSQRKKLQKLVAVRQ